MKPHPLVLAVAALVLLPLGGLALTAPAGAQSAAAAPAVTAIEVNEITYRGSQGGTGTFHKTAVDAWTETAADGAGTFHFVQTGLLGDVIALEDASRAVKVEIHLNADQVRASQNGSAFFLLAPILTKTLRPFPFGGLTTINAGVGTEPGAGNGLGLLPPRTEVIVTDYRKDADGKLGYLLVEGDDPFNGRLRGWILASFVCVHGGHLPAWETSGQC